MQQGKHAVDGGKHFLIVHENHRIDFNGNKKEIKTIGLCELTDVREFPPFGLTIFGNFRYLQEDIFLAMRAGKLPYLSVETRDNGVSGEIDSVALLSNAEPKFCYHAFTPDTLVNPVGTEYERYRKNQKEIDEIFVKYGGNIMPDANTIAGNPSLTSGGSPAKTMAQAPTPPTAPMPAPVPNNAPAILGNAGQQIPQPPVQPGQQMQQPGGDVLSIVKQILQTLTDHIAKGDMKSNEKNGEEKGEGYMEEPKEKKNEAETKVVEQAASINPNFCSREFVVLARKFSDVDIDVLKKLESAGLSESQIETLIAKKTIEPKVNEKQPFTTPGNKREEVEFAKAKKTEEFAPEDLPIVAILQKDMEIYNRQNNKDLKVTKGMVEAHKKVTDLRDGKI